MNTKVKRIFLCLLPFIIAGMVGFMYAAPAYTDLTAKTEEVETKKKSLEELKAKLVDKSKIQKEQKQLTDTIESLRSSVPKAPDLPILNIDLEQMALDSGLEVVAFQEPSNDDIKRAGLDDASGAAKDVKDKVKAAAGKGDAGKGKGGESPDGGLSKSYVQFKTFGSYKSLMNFARKLETYERVVAISDLKVSLPKGADDKNSDPKKMLSLPDDAEIGEGDRQGDWNRLNITMLLTAYYLP